MAEGREPAGQRHRVGRHPCIGKMLLRVAVPGSFCFLYLMLQYCVFSQSRSIGLNPLYVMLPCTLSASFAFMLPVATPPNAIVFAYGHLKVSDMVMQCFYLLLSAVMLLS